MLYAHCKSVREERSKHRYALQDFSEARVNLVKGKAGWRITGSEAILNHYHSAQSREERARVHALFGLIRRFVGAEEVHTELYDECTQALVSVREGNANSLETVFAVRLLFRLGYVAPSESLSPILKSPHILETVSHLSPEVLRSCKRTIAHAESVSHL